MASIYQQNKERRRTKKIYTTGSRFSEEEKNKVINELVQELKTFKKDKNVKRAMNISKKLGAFIFETKNGVPDKIAENRGHALMTNILMGIVEQRPSREIVADLRRLSS
jgi:hypothetical protein